MFSALFSGLGKTKMTMNWKPIVVSVGIVVFNRCNRRFRCSRVMQKKPRGYRGYQHEINQIKIWDRSEHQDAFKPPADQYKKLFDDVFV